LWGETKGDERVGGLSTKGRTGKVSKRKAKKKGGGGTQSEGVHVSAQKKKKEEWRRAKDKAPTTVSGGRRKIERNSCTDSRTSCLIFILRR